MNFDNDSANDEDRVEYLRSKQAHVEQVNGEGTPEFNLHYRGGTMRLDATDESNALYEACNIV